MTLQHKHVGSANGFGVAHIHLAIGEVVGGGLENIDAELVRNVGGQLGMRPACYENEIFIGFSSRIALTVSPNVGRRLRVQS